MKKKNLLTVLFAAGIAFASFNGAFAADKYLCKWQTASGTNKTIYTTNMTAEQFCAPSKHVSEQVYKDCINKDFKQLKDAYYTGKCKKYVTKIHSDTNNSARCFVEITDDPADGYIMNCYGPTANTFRPKVEKMYQK